MKKLLVVLMAAIMVLSFAVASMAAATVEGDFRVEWIKEDGATIEDLKYYQSDLRLNFKGQVSDTIDAYMQVSVNKVGTDSTANTQSFADSLALKEWYVTFKESWGKAMTGQWDYKLVPSRVLIKSHGSLNCVNPKSMQWLFEIPVGEAFTAGLWLVPTAVEDGADYDVKLAYKADSFGAEVHYGQADSSSNDSTYQSFDVYYNVTDSIKACVYGVNAGDDLKTWDKKLAPVAGVTFKNIAGSQLTASLEYGIEKITVGSDDYNQIAAQFKYKFNNKLALEVEYTNYNKVNKIADTKENKIVIRPRIAF